MHPSANRPVSVAVVDDARDIRLMLELYLSLCDTVEVLASVGTAAEAVAVALALKPAVMTLDEEMTGPSGTDALALIKRASPNTKIIMFTASPASGEPEAMLAAGADAVVAKSGPLDALYRQIIHLAALSPTLGVPTTTTRPARTTVDH